MAASSSASSSIGIVTYPDDAVDAETLLKNADFAMYQAKDSGRNNYQFFKSDLNVTALERQAVEHGLRHAIHRDDDSFQRSIYRIGPRVGTGH